MTVSSGASAESEELELLRRENAELRAKLEMALGPVQQATPIELELPILGEGLPAIDNGASVHDKIKRFRALFRGREDIYPVLWINERLGKKGYKPACAESWNAKNGPKKYLPLTDAVVQDHLSGKTTIGVYPLLNDNTCHFLACDFDGAGWLLDALAYLDACRRHNIPAYLERSRSGNGAHVWIFFAAAVPATAARQLGVRLIRQAMDQRGDLDLGSYDRLFPNQDFMPKGGFGNLIALPLQKKCRVLGNTEFIDVSLPEPRPFADQWAFLSGIRRITPAQLEALLEIVPPVAVGPGAVVAAAVRARQPALPAVKAVLGASVSIETSGLPPWLRARLKHLASLHNPEFYKREKLRFSTFQTPRFIRCYAEDLSHIHLPRGILKQIEDAVEAAGSCLDLSDQRPVAEKLSLRFEGSLRPEQQSAVDALLKHALGVLVAPPGAGKTVMGCAAIARRNVPALVLAHRKPLLDQWRAQLMTLLGLSSREIGQIGGGRDRQRGIVDLAMIQSLARRRDELESLFSRYGFIVVDECHHIPALEFEGCLKKAPARYFLGLTATPYRRDGLHEIIAMQCGPMRYEISAVAGRLPLNLIVRETPFGYADDMDRPIQELLKGLSQDDMRNGLIVKDVAEAAAKGRRCLILGQRKDHCAVLAAALSSRGVESFLLDGLQGKKHRAALVQAIKDVPTSKPLIVIATGQYLGEGFDCPQMDTLFMASPASFKGRLVQYVGRIMRDHPGKTDALVYDYVDSHVDVLKRMYFKRLKTYRTLNAISREE